MSNRFDDENNIEMDIKTALFICGLYSSLSWGTMAAACTPGGSISCPAEEMMFAA